MVLFRKAEMVFNGGLENISNIPNGEFIRTGHIFVLSFVPFGGSGGEGLYEEERTYTKSDCTTCVYLEEAGSGSIYW